MIRQKGTRSMKFVKQLAVILVFSFLGELLHSVAPLPIPASIWGMALLLLALLLKIVKVEQVKETGQFLVSLLPLLFVAPAVGILACWDLVKGNLPAILAVIVLTTALTFGAAGLVTKLTGKGGEDHG